MICKKSKQRVKWAEDAEFEEIMNSRQDGKQESTEMSHVHRKLNEILPKGKELLETPVFDDWGQFHSSKARQELHVLQLADLDVDVTKDALGSFVLGQTHQNILWMPRRANEKGQGQ